MPIRVIRCHAAPGTWHIERTPRVTPDRRIGADLEGVIVRNLVERFQDNDASIDYMPLPCIADALNSSRSMAGRVVFSVVSMYWALGGRERLQQYLCGGAQPIGQHGTFMQRFFVLMLDGPSYAPSWQGPGHEIKYHRIPAAPAGTTFRCGK